MQKLAYITSDYFVDVDIPVVKELNKKYDLVWYIYTKVGNEQRFTVSELENVAAENNIKHKIIVVTTRFRSLKQLFIDLRTAFELRKIKADIYYFQTFVNPYLPAFVHLFLNIKRVIVAVHDVMPHKNFRSFLSRMNDKFYLTTFKNYHFFSETQRKIYLENYKPKNILLAPLCLKDFGTPEGKITKNCFTFLFFGVIQYYKGLDFLIKAANKLNKEFNNFKVVIAGKCDDFSPYQPLIENPELFDLRLETIPNSDIPDLFMRSDFLVLPYRDVTQSGPLLIAFNYGIPVIASNFDGFRGYISENKTGFLFEAGNVDALYTYMKKALLLPPQELDTIKQNIKNYVKEEISMESIAQKYVTYFDELIDK